MLNSGTLYFIGLALVSLYLLTGIDDFIWDLAAVFRRFRQKEKPLDIHALDKIPPKLLAVAVAAWHEDNVLGDVIDNFVESTHYSKSMYHIFLGVYPNDAPTIAVAQALAEKHANVHVIINCQPGPTSKAQNINHVIREIKEFEREKRWRFASLTIHDSEDVVHPYELKVTNYLLDTYDAMQFPVFPLVQMPRFSNFFPTITTGTYADEFAENHYTTMVNRRDAGAFVPSAGTGFVLSRKTLDSFGDEDVLPSNSLTEDYRLSLTLFEKGIQMYYVLEKVPRINKKDALVWDFIATRSMFPNTFQTAVKQKTRWILGITMQSFKLRDIFKMKGLKLAGRYSLYKDLKAKVGNLLVFVGYPILIYFAVSLFRTLDPIYPMYTLSWWLSILVTAMMIERQVFRSIAIGHVYGMRSIFFACFFPPLLPLRLIWGNTINMVATMRAYKQRLFGNQSKSKGSKKKAPLKKTKSAGQKQLAWAKTDHSFLPKTVLKRYHRQLGDVLLEKGYINAEQLQTALQNAFRNKQSIGAYLMEQEIITERQLLTALSNIKHIQYFDSTNIHDYTLTEYASFFDAQLLKSLLAVPLLKTETGFVIAFCDKSPIDAQTTLRNRYNITVHAAFASQESVEEALHRMYEPSAVKMQEPSLIRELFSDGIIGYEQLALAYHYKNTLQTTEQETLRQMGLLPEEELHCLPIHTAHFTTV